MGYLRYPIFINVISFSNTENYISHLKNIILDSYET